MTLYCILLTLSLLIALPAFGQTMIDVTTNNARDTMLANPSTKTIDKNGTVFMKVSGVMRNERTGNADGISLTTLGYNCTKNVFYSSDGTTMLNMKHEIILNQPHTKYLTFPAKGKLIYKHQSNFYKGFCPEGPTESTVKK